MEALRCPHGYWVLTLPPGAGPTLTTFGYWSSHAGRKPAALTMPRVPDIELGKRKQGEQRRKSGPGKEKFETLGPSKA